MPTQRNYPLAAVLALAAFTIWVISDALLKYARIEGITLGEVLLICGAGSMAVIFVVSAMRGKISHLKPHNLPGLIVLGVLQLGAFICWMIALPYLPLANMYVVSFLTPLTVACMAALFLKERMGWKRGIAIAIGFGGVLIAVDPQTLFNGRAAWLPYFFLFGHMLSSATQMFLLRVMMSKEETSECIACYPRGIVALGGLAMCLSKGFSPLKPCVFWALCLSGALAGISWALIAQAYKNAQAAAVAPFQYSQIITGALLGYLVWSDLPSAYLIGGSIIIIASGLYLIRHERRISRMLVRVE